MVYTKEILKKAHKHSFKNGEEVKGSKKCGCFQCVRIFESSEIELFMLERDNVETAFCPYCGVDSIIGDKSGYELTKEFLTAMCEEWFGKIIIDID